ncbi:MAG TPA: IPT/TIG domain-containing protein [Thermoanaerobaculia bacterium]|nr:IPT/TIG domain-containing protein [Thermoanaerobaculia bacterium]
MKVLRGRKYLFALLALLVVFAACKGESPTAPTAGGGGGGGTGGGGTPPVGATITLTASNPTPLTSSTTVITATVTQGGNPVQNGTAVEFGTSIGNWTDTGLTTTIKTTTNGVATATLTSATPGTAVVTAVVNNVTKTVSVTFSSTPTTNPPPTTAPTVTSMTPTSGKPEGGDLVTITGTNFRTPIRVIFDVGGGVTKEAFVAAVTPTQVQAITPQVNLGAGQTLDAAVNLINEAGTPNEVKVLAPVFTYRKAQLTPVITTLSPDSGPITGGTRITIFGSGFEAPVQVSFSPGGTSGGQGWAQMQVLSVTFDQIIALTPPARDVNSAGSGTLTGPVDIRIININSGTNAVTTNAFRYTPAMQITGARPLIGTSLGGTDVTIDGIGFDPPVDVFIGDVLAQVLRVSGTQILARTSPLANPCAGGGGDISVTNINNGDTAKAPVSFNFIGVEPVILSVTPSAGITPGSTITVDVQDPGVGPLGTAIVKFSIGGQSISPTPNVISVGTGVQTFTLVVPATGFTFPTVQCTTAAASPGTQLGTISTTLLFTNQTTNCTATLDGMVLTPPGPNTCLAPPTATVVPASPTCLAMGNVPVGTTSAPQTFTISNAASARDLTVGPPTSTGTNTTTITVTPGIQQTITAGTTAPPYSVTVVPTAAGAFSGTITLTTNDPTKPTVQVCFSGTGI